MLEKLLFKPELNSVLLGAIGTALICLLLFLIAKLIQHFKRKKFAQIKDNMKELNELIKIANQKAEKLNKIFKEL